MFSLLCAWTFCSANNTGAGDLRGAHYDVTVMIAAHFQYDRKEAGGKHAAANQRACYECNI